MRLDIPAEDPARGLGSQQSVTADKLHVSGGHGGALENVSKKTRTGGGFSFPEPGSDSGFLLLNRWSAEEEANKPDSVPKEFALTDFGFDKCQTLVFEVRLFPASILCIFSNSLLDYGSSAFSPVVY